MLTYRFQVDKTLVCWYMFEARCSVHTDAHIVGWGKLISCLVLVASNAAFMDLYPVLFQRLNASQFVYEILSNFVALFTYIVFVICINYVKDLT